MPPKAIYEHSGPAELVLEGENLTPETLKLYHNGVLYTPLESSDTYAYYLLGDNGTNKMMLNGSNFIDIVIKDVVVPEVLPIHMEMSLRATASITSPAVNNIVGNSVNCLNYPYKATEELPYFGLRIGAVDKPFKDTERLEGVNCTVSGSGSSEVYKYVAALPTDPTKPAYITYQGFIIAVFNYSA